MNSDGQGISLHVVIWHLTVVRPRLGNSDVACPFTKAKNLKQTLVIHLVT